MGIHWGPRARPLNLWAIGPRNQGLEMRLCSVNYENFQYTVSVLYDIENSEPHFIAVHQVTSPCTMIMGLLSTLKFFGWILRHTEASYQESHDDHLPGHHEVCREPSKGLWFCPHRTLTYVDIQRVFLGDTDDDGWFWCPKHVRSGVEQALCMTINEKDHKNAVTGKLASCGDAKTRQRLSLFSTPDSVS